MQEVTKFKIYTNIVHVRMVHWNSVISACRQLFSHRSTCFWEILPVVTEGSPSKTPPSSHSPFPPWSSFQPSLLWEGLHTLRGVLLRTPRGVLLRIPRGVLLRIPWGVLFRDAKFVERNLLSTDLLVVLSWQCCCSSVHQHQIQNASKLDLFFDPMYKTAKVVVLVHVIIIVIVMVHVQVHGITKTTLSQREKERKKGERGREGRP